MPRRRTWMQTIMDTNVAQPINTHGSAGVTTSGTVLTAPAGAQRLVFQPTSGTIRMMVGGTATDTNGFTFAAGAVPYSILVEPSQILSFAATAGTVSLMYQWLG